MNIREIAESYAAKATDFGLSAVIEHGVEFAGMPATALVTVQGVDRTLEIFVCDPDGCVDAYMTFPASEAGIERVRGVRVDYIEWHLSMMKARQLAN